MGEIADAVNEAELTEAHARIAELEAKLAETQVRSHQRAEKVRDLEAAFNKYRDDHAACHYKLGKYEAVVEAALRFVEAQEAGLPTRHLYIALVDSLPDEMVEQSGIINAHEEM